MASLGLVLLFILASVLACTDAKGYLYGLKQNASDGIESLFLEEIDPDTAQVVRRGQFDHYELAGQGLACIDDTEGIYFTVATNSSARDIVLLGISLKTLQRLHEVKLPFLQEGFVGVGQYCSFDPVTTDIIVEGRDTQVPHEHHLWKYNHKTGKIVSLTRVFNTGMVDLLGGFSVLDFDQGIDWLQLAFNDSGRIGDRFFGYDTDSGFLLNIINNPEYLATGRYDPQNQAIYGVGSRIIDKEPGFEHTLVEFSSSSAAFQVKSVLPFINYMGAICAFDIRRRLLYVFMSNTTHPGMQNGEFELAERYCLILKQRHGRLPSLCNKFLTAPPPPKLPSMDLVSINVDSGKVFAHPQLCEEFPLCPLSIEFWNRE